MTRRQPGGAPATMVVERWVDDRTARVELDGDLVELPRSLLPSDAVRDDVLRVERSAERVMISIDRAATGAARRRGEQLASRLRRRDPGGDLTT